MSTASDILMEAASLVSIDRHEKHGEASENLGNIGALWSFYLGTPISAKQVAMMMVLLKVARTKTGAPTSDNYVDMAGYAGLAGALS